MTAEHTRHHHDKISRLKIFLIGIVVVIVLSGLIFVAVNKIGEKMALNRKIMGMEAAVNGTPIMATRDAIKEAIASGQDEVSKDAVLLGKSGDDYVCTIETDKGIITLKKRGDLMREEMIREKTYNTSVLFLQNSVFILHPLYLKWARFDYKPDMKMSTSTYLYSAFSFNELTQINATNYRCVQIDLPQNEFSLGEYPVVDAQAYLDNQSIFTRLKSLKKD